MVAATCCFAGEAQEVSGPSDLADTHRLRSNGAPLFLTRRYFQRVIADMGRKYLGSTCPVHKLRLQPLMVGVAKCFATLVQGRDGLFVFPLLFPRP